MRRRLCRRDAALKDVAVDLHGLPGLVEQQIGQVERPQARHGRGRRGPAAGGVDAPDALHALRAMRQLGAPERASILHGSTTFMRDSTLYITGRADRVTGGTSPPGPAATLHLARSRTSVHTVPDRPRRAGILRSATRSAAPNPASPARWTIACDRDVDVVFWKWP